jgi:hypothetical protein
MKRTLSILSAQVLTIVTIVAALSACEVFTIGGNTIQLTNINQFSPQGTVLLFKSELDSNNIVAATRILSDSNRKRLLTPVEKYDLRFEVERYRRLLSKRSITELTTDTLAKNVLAVHAEFDYLKRLKFTTVKFNNRWYIAAIDLQ